jgi:hypothetical protein
MEKAIVSRDYILSWMNSEIAKYDAGKDCHFISITLTEPDEYGGNWSAAELRCSGAAIEEYQPIAQQIIDEAKEKFIVG